MSGTNHGKESLSDTNKLNEPSMEDLALAIQKGDMSELDRLMAVETAPETQETPGEPENASAEPETPAVEDEAEDKDAKTEGEQPETPEVEEPTPSATPEAAPVAASPATPNAQEIDQLRQELHRYKSDAGRVPFMQRRMAELERELRQFKAQTPNNPNGVKPNPSDINSVELDDETKAQIEELRSIDPVYAKTVERAAKAAIAAATTKAQNSFDSYVSATQADEDERFYIEQKARLLELVPQAEQVFQTPEWKQWKATLSPGRRAMAESAYAEEVRDAIYAFAADMQRYQQGNVAAAPVQQPVQQAPQPTPSAPEESEVEKARKQRMQKAAGVPNPSAKKEQQLDPEAYFTEAYNQIARQQGLIK